MHLKNKTLFSTYLSVMKKILLVALLSLPALLKAQQAVIFKIKYTPSHSYNMAVNFNMKMNVTITGDSTVLQKLKAEGITQPVNAILGLGADGTIKTGPMGSDNTFPLTMDFKIDSLAASANGKQAPIPPMVTDKKLHIVGHVGQDNVMTVDSANGKKASDSTQKSMQQMMSMLQRQIKFPETPMKPGDSFTQTMPFNMPIKGGKGDVKIEASVTYKLNSISNGKAYFDMMPSFSMNFSGQKINIEMSGTGTGKMVYSIKDNFPVSKEGTFNMKLKVTSEKVNVDGTAVITSSSTTVIN
jgi:hypothetical protein